MVGGDDLARVAKKFDIEFLDPRTTLRLEAFKYPLLYPEDNIDDSFNDSHFNNYGHKVFGKILYDYVTSISSQTFHASVEESPNLEWNKYFSKHYDFDYNKTFRVFVEKIPLWDNFLNSFKGKPNIHCLGIGVNQGRSAIWVLENILTHPSAKLTGIDSFPDGTGLKEQYLSNLKLSGVAHKTKTLEGFSQVELKKLPLNSFDIIYIDGDHRAKSVLADAVLSFDLLKKGGILIFGNYFWYKKEIPIALKSNCEMIGNSCDPALAEYHWLEAEHAKSIVSPLEIAYDKNASGNRFIYCPNNTKNTYVPSPIMAIYKVHITKPGIYILWGNVKMKDKKDNSFFVQIDKGENNLWEIESENKWHWDKVNNRNGEDPVKFMLTPGIHTIRVKLREDGTKLDKMLLTNCLDFVPSGKGSIVKNQDNLLNNVVGN